MNKLPKAIITFKGKKYPVRAYYWSETGEDYVVAKSTGQDIYVELSKVEDVEYPETSKVNPFKLGEVVPNNA